MKNSIGNTLEDYTKAMNEVCPLYNIPILDLYTNSGINQNNLIKYSDDSCEAKCGRNGVNRKHNWTIFKYTLMSNRTIIFCEKEYYLRGEEKT